MFKERIVHKTDLILIFHDGMCHYLTTNLEGLELFTLIKQLKQNKLVKEVR